LAAGDQRNPKLSSDGANGAIITWYDFRNGSTNTDIYSQRIDSSGIIQWTSSGVPICAATGNQQKAAIISDGGDGAIIA